MTPIEDEDLQLSNASESQDWLGPLTLALKGDVGAGGRREGNRRQCCSLPKVEALSIKVDHSRGGTVLAPFTALLRLRTGDQLFPVHEMLMNKNLKFFSSFL